jgi:hypothetical protein
MAFLNMYQQLLGVPGTNLGLCKTFINEALAMIQDENVWSFQCKVGGWLTPGLIGGFASGQGQNQSFNAGNTFVSPGTITVAPYANTITGDAVATATWNNLAGPPLLTQYQIRVPYYSLYNIIALGTDGTLSYLTVNSAGSGQTPGVYVVNGVNTPSTPGSGAQVQITVNADGTVTLPPVVLNAGSGYTYPPTFSLAAGGTPAVFSATLTAQLTIDRPWMEPAQVNGIYAAYQAYFAAPPNWKRWWQIRDTTNNFEMDYSSYTQIDLAREDAERTVFNEPTNVVYYGQDQRSGSATIGQALFELWGHPLTELPYTFGCQCNWPPLVNPYDTVPFPLTDELVKWRALEVLYQWKESQKGDDMERGSGANWQFLSQAARTEYEKRLKQIRIMDRHIVDLYFTKVRHTPAVGNQDGFATQTGQVNIGNF